MYDQCLRETETSAPVAPCTLYVKKKCMFLVLFNTSIQGEKERKGGGAGGGWVKGSVILTTLADLSLHTP